MDKKYWKKVYKAGGIKEDPSPFAVEVANRLIKGRKLLELGCGNGRDAIYFAQMGILVFAIDQVLGVSYERKLEFKECSFHKGDFVKTSLFNRMKFNYIYSRFSIHSITEAEQREVLSNAFNALVPGGLFFIEARSIHDDIFGMGKRVGKNEFIYQNHYRRFLDANELEKQLIDQGFIIELIEEGRGFAVYYEEDPVVIRVIASKKS